MNTAPVYNIKAVVKQTGLNPATIRAWERRYGFPRPKRTAGGHRQYSQYDIDTLKWLIARQEEGVSISHAIELWQSRVDTGEDPLRADAATAGQPSTQVEHVLRGGQIDKLREAWVSACLAFDKETAEQILTGAFALFNPETVCIELLQKGLAEVGDGWYEGEVSVHQEHFASALSIQRLEMLISAQPAPTRPERIIVATASKDYHIFSPLLLTFLLQQKGWEVIFLGVDVPAEELESTIESVKPELIIVSAQLLHTAANLKDIALIAKSKNVTLAFGGFVFNLKPALRSLIPGHFLGETLEDAVQWVSKSIVAKPPDPRWIEDSDNYQQILAQYNERRALIESHVWGAFIAADAPVKQLSSINSDFAQMIEAALKLGDIGLLATDISEIEYLFMSYHLSKEQIGNYVLAYYQAAKVHLGESATIIVDWLAQMISE